MKAKYTTLTELAAAFKSGELDGSYYLLIDKGGCLLRLRRRCDGMSNSEADASYDECQKIFRREHEDSVAELLKIAGIPAEWC